MSEDATSIRFRHENECTYIVIDRVDRNNMVTLPMIGTLANGFRSLPRETKVVHLTGAGTDFCRGRDPQSDPIATSATEIRALLLDPILDLYDAISACPVPIVCSVRGAARGFGAALSVACDITIAAADARFSLPEMERNIPPTLAMSAMLQRVGPKALAYLVYSTAEISADLAEKFGLASVVVPNDELSAAVDKLLGNLRSRSKSALVAVKTFQSTAPGLLPRAKSVLAAEILANVVSSRHGSQ